MELMKRFIKEEAGQGLVEYALIVGLIALAATAFIVLAGGSVKTIWTNISDRLGEAAANDGLSE